MPLTLTPTPVNILKMNIVASESSYVNWTAYRVYQSSNETQFILDPTIASATYTIDNSPVVWGLSGTGTISVTALNDTASIIISGSHTAGSDNVKLWPYYTDQYLICSTQLSASVSAFYRQVASGSITAVPVGTEILWNIIPSVTGLYTGLGYKINENAYNDTLTNTNPARGYAISGAAPAASEIDFNYKGSSYDARFYTTTQIINDAYHNGNLSASITYHEPQTQIILNPSVNIKVASSQSTYTVLSAVQNDLPVIPTTSLIWNVNDTFKVIGLSGTSLTLPASFGTPGFAGQIELSALDLTNSYQYSLSSFTGTVSGTFRPYNTITQVSVLTSRNIKLENENNVYKYSFQALGITNNAAHIISPLQWIRWECDSNAVVARRSDDVTSYNFGTQSTSENIDNLIVRITPSIVSTVPKLCSANFQLCALSGSRLEDGIYGKYNFNITFSEWLDENYLNSKFRFQYEPENQTTIYRPTVSSVTYYTLSNTSIVPPDSRGFITYTFNSGASSISVPYIRTNSDALSTATIQYPFSVSTNCICSISMTVCASAIGYSDYFVKEAPTKHIIFTDIPVVSGFVIYPEWTWSEATSSWAQAVYSYGSNQGNILIPTAPLSAYGICHTENFFLSSNIVSADEYKWSIQDDTNNSIIPVTTTVNTATAWVKIKTGANSAFLSVCASVFNGLMSSSNMPTTYYDDPTGTRFRNFSTTYDPIISTHRRPIKIVGIDNLGIKANLSDIDYIQQPVPNTLYLSGEYTTVSASSLFNVYANSFYFNLSTEFWNERQTAKTIDRNAYNATTELDIKVDDIGDSFLGVPLNEKTLIRITPELNYTLQLLCAHPSSSDWCLNSISAFDETSRQIVTAFPMLPVVYNSNRFSLTGISVTIENMVQCFSGVSSLTWNDRNNLQIKTTCAPYVTTFDAAGIYDIDLTNNYHLGSSLVTPLQNTFPSIVTIQNEYLPYNSDVSRIFGFTKIKLPYDVRDCSMSPNEWVVADTFNTTIRKLYDNLDYLNNMSQLYDVPPTEYIGWFGSIYYNNSAARTRWFTNTPQNSYNYDHPERSIDYVFNDLQSCYVRNNMMYISNGTSVSILSGDFWGTQLGNRTYKTLGDDFINIRSVKLDSTGRIYMLDSYNSNNLSVGTKNRVLVFSFDYNTLQWQLLYEWGGLGGPGAKNKFNSPSDLYIDANDGVWVTDTNNKCVKKYTRTGSWVNTITSEYFDDIEKPISVFIDSSDNLYVLTTSQIVKFDSSGIFSAIFNVDAGGLRLQNCQDGGFVYIVYSDRIVKFALYGAAAGIIAESDFTTYNKDYRNVFHDEYRNLYIVNRNHILKYIDLLALVSLKLDTNGLVWDYNKLLVQKDEYIQDWVINRCFQRLWDNLEIFRQSLIGKFGYQTFKNTTRTTFVSSQPMPDDFDLCKYDWLYSYGTFVTQDITYEYQKPVVKTFTTAEYKTLPYVKESIYVGINELNSAEVYNRAIAKLHECEEVLLQMIND